MEKNLSAYLEGFVNICMSWRSEGIGLQGKVVRFIIYIYIAKPGVELVIVKERAKVRRKLGGMQCFNTRFFLYTPMNV